MAIIIPNQVLQIQRVFLSYSKLLKYILNELDVDLGWMQL